MKKKLWILAACVLLVLALIGFVLLPKNASEPAPTEQQSAASEPITTSAAEAAAEPVGESGEDNTVPIADDTITVETNEPDASGDAVDGITVEETEDGVVITVPDDMEIGGF